MIKINMMTKWFEKEIACCCPVKDQCLKNHDCEEMEFYYDPYGSIQECMGHDSYKRDKHGIKQVRHG